MTKKIHIIELPKNIKYKKFCKMIYNRYNKDFINKSDEDTSINIHKLMNILIDNLSPTKNISYARNVKYSQMDFINGIIEVLLNNTYWRRYKGIVKGKYLNAKHLEYKDLGVYECMYGIISMIYFKESKFKKLKHQSIDSTFIRNLYGVELIQRNPHYKSKNGIKVSQINAHEVPISFAIAKGAVNDAKIAIQQIDHNLIDCETNKVKNNNRYKQKFYGDSHYHSSKLIKKLKKKGYTPITDVNIRNTKDELKKKKLEKERMKYSKVKSKRAMIEISFAWLHKYPKLNRYVEKTIKSYSGLLLLGASLTVAKKIY
jgi:ssDNA-binding Zn-finger/Zn-ribbon topoisomerase 1